MLREWTGTDGLAGTVVSSTIVSLTFTETNPLASLNWALTVFVPSPAGLSVIGSVIPALYACHGSPPTKFGEAALTWVTSLSVFGKVRETAVVLVPALPPLIRTVPVGGGIKHDRVADRRSRGVADRIDELHVHGLGAIAGRQRPRDARRVSDRVDPEKSVEFEISTELTPLAPAPSAAVRVNVTFLDVVAAAPPLIATVPVGAVVSSVDRVARRRADQLPAASRHCTYTVFVPSPPPGRVHAIGAL